MNFKFSLFVLFAIIHLSCSSPLSSKSDDEFNLEEKVRIKRNKLDVPTLQEVASKVPEFRKGIDQQDNEKPAKTEEKKQKERKKEKLNGTPDISAETLTVPSIPSLLSDQPASRVKKQSNLDCNGQTACGKLVSAQGSAVPEVRRMLEGNQRSSAAQYVTEFDGPIRNAMNPTSDQQRTVDIAHIFGFSPSSSTSGFGSSSGYGSSIGSFGGGSSQSGGYGHSIFKPQVSAPEPAFPHGTHPLHSIIAQHPGLTGFGFPSYQDAYVVPGAIRQPIYVPATSHDNDPLICERIKVKKPLEIQYPAERIDKIEDVKQETKIQNPAERGDKIDAKLQNILEDGKESPKSQESTQASTFEDRMKAIAEIKDEIGQLNRAAQQLINKQSELAATQHRHMMYNNMRSAEEKQIPYYPYGDYLQYPYAYPYDNYRKSPADDYEERNAKDKEIQGYQGNRYRSYGNGYSRANAASFPDTQEDMVFFVKLFTLAKQMGLLSNELKYVTAPPVDSKEDSKPSGDQKPKQSEDAVSDLLNGDKQQTQTDKEPATKGTKTKTGKN